jgi:cytoskeletal protein CcmA (bactofilin family)
MIKKIVIGIMLALFALTSVAGVAMASSTDNQTNVVLPTADSHKGLYVRTGENVTIDGTITGDAWLAGSKVVINGDIDGSLYAAASEVIVKGVVRGNVMAAGSRVTIEGKIGGSAYLAGSEITTDNQSTVAGSMVAFGSIYNQQGSVGTQAYLFGSQVTIDGPIGSNTKIYASEVTLGKNAQINGNLAYASDAKVSIANDKNITGSITKIADTAKPNAGTSIVAISMGTVFMLAASLLLGLVAFSVLPGSARATADWEQSHLTKTLLYGIGFAFLVPVVLLVTALTLVGFELAILGLLVYIAVLMLGGVMTAYCIGKWLLKRKTYSTATLALELLVGVGILSVIGLIPFVGSLVGFFAAIAGIGAIVGRSRERLMAVRAKQIPTKA